MDEAHNFFMTRRCSIRIPARAGCIGHVRTQMTTHTAEDPEIVMSDPIDSSPTGSDTCLARFMLSKLVDYIG